ncbi:MAG: DNA polymerase III subunit delta [Catenulispora sp.]
MPADTAAPPRLVLVVGAEELLLDRAVARIVAARRALDPETESRDLTPSTFSPGTLAELVSPSLFGESRVVVVRAAQDLAADDAAVLTSALDNLAEEITLIVVHLGGPKGKALLTAVEKAGAWRIDVAKVTKPAERIAFLREEFKAAKRQITEEAARALLDAVGNDLRELAAAAAQLIADTSADQPGAIDETVVAKYYSGRAEVSGFTVADLAVDGRTAQALEQLRWALATGTAPVLITSALAAGVRSVARVASAPRSARPADLARDLGMPPWKIDKVRQQVRGWTPDGISTALLAVAEADAAVKGGGEDSAYALERCVVTVCQARGRGGRG